MRLGEASAELDARLTETTPEEIICGDPVDAGIGAPPNAARRITRPSRSPRPREDSSMCSGKSEVAGTQSQKAAPSLSMTERALLFRPHERASKSNRFTVQLAHDDRASSSWSRQEEEQVSRDRVGIHSLKSLTMV